MNDHARLGHFISPYVDEEARMEEMVENFSSTSASIMADCIRQIGELSSVDFSLMKVDLF